MEETITIEYYEPTRHIFVSRTNQDGNTVDLKTIKVPEVLDVIEEAVELFEIYSDDMAYEDYMIELQPLEYIEGEVKD